MQNDPRIYIRTGNITPSVDLASPEATELLIGKKEKAQLARKIYIKQSNDIYMAGLRRAERERLKLIAIEKGNYNKEKQIAINEGRLMNDYKSRYYPKVLGSEASVFTIVIQPFFPGKQLAAPNEIKSKIIEIRDGDRTFVIHFPELNPEPIPEGIMTFEWGENDGQLRNEQFYSTGLVRLSFDVLRADGEDKRIMIVHLASLLFGVLKAAGNFYRLFNYQGGLKGYLSLDNVEAIKLIPQMTSSYFPGNDKEGLLPYYNLNLDIDTSLLNNNKAFQDYFIKKVQEIYWMFGYEDVAEDTVKSYLKNEKWLVE